jgi:tRNA pseudouridine32 synthase / 23S rRNA pseudouridine746 synthase
MMSRLLSCLSLLLFPILNHINSLSVRRNNIFKILRYRTSRAVTVLYWDDDIIAVNKPPNLPSVPSLEFATSLVDKIAKWFNHPRSDKMVVHRLDYATSGVILFARNDGALTNLHLQFRRKSTSPSFSTRLGAVRKTYHAIVAGTMKAEDKLNPQKIDLPIGPDPIRGKPYYTIDSLNGKASLTAWKWVAENAEKNKTLIELSPITGR